MWKMKWSNLEVPLSNRSCVLSLYVIHSERVYVVLTFGWASNQNVERREHGLSVPRSRCEKRGRVCVWKSRESEGGGGGGGGDAEVVAGSNSVGFEERRRWREGKLRVRRERWIWRVEKGESGGCSHWFDAKWEWKKMGKEILSRTQSSRGTPRFFVWHSLHPYVSTIINFNLIFKLIN